MSCTAANLSSGGPCSSDFFIVELGVKAIEECVVFFAGAGQ